MDVYRTEEEQLEAVKRWLRTNGVGLVVAIGLALALTFGWRYWNERQEMLRDQGGARYEALLQAVEQARQSGDSDARTTAQTLAMQMKNDFKGNAYGTVGALFAAALAVDAGDLDAAAGELRWILEQRSDPVLAALARYRLARVVLAQGEPGEALEILGTGDPQGYAAVYEQLRGDILLAQGNRDGARAAYEKARTLYQETEALPGDPLLELKLHDLGAGRSADA
ncbi:MAG: tetratricopeptide repeat protein [Spongiibacteraceae bacterium]|nr:tetratricopeptide repeat protein [Spongiibacteraceae bacterium]